MDQNNYLIFILGISESQVSEICSEGLLDINYIETKSDRHNLYLKGGVFAPTSRTLIIDLLTNKISPHIINGFVIIDGEETLKGSPAIGENMFMSNTRFILKVYRRDNKDGFIKVFSSNPGLLASKHLNIRDAMKASYVNTLLLYPRNRLEVKESLNSDEILDVHEIDIDLSKCMKEIQQIIITLIHTCLQTLEKELRSYELSDEVFKIESVFNDTFKNSLKNELGNEFNELGDKANRALFDIRLLRYLLTSLYGNDATYFHMAVLETKETCNSYSIFKFSDQETTDLLEKLEQLSKKRMYSIEAKEDGAIKKKKSMGIFSKNSKIHFDSIGKLNQANVKIWEEWSTQIKESQPALIDVEETHCGFITMECSPKWNYVVSYLQKIYDEFTESNSRQLKFDDVSPTNIDNIKQSESEEDNAKLTDCKNEEEKCESKTQKNIKIGLSSKTAPEFKRILIVTGNMCNCRDLEKYIASIFISKQKQLKYYCQKLFFMTNCYKEAIGRSKDIENSKTPINRKREIYLINKLALLLDQKNKEMIESWNSLTFTKRKRELSRYFNKFDDENIESKNKEESKEETKEKPKEASQSKKSSLCLSEDMDFYSMFENDPEGFDPVLIIPNGVVQICSFKMSESSSILSEFCPTEVILLESDLQFIRSVEVYNARQFKANSNSQKLKLTILFYNDSSEKFYHECTIHKEKRAFESLIRIKDKEFINIVDPKLEEEQALK